MFEMFTKKDKRTDLEKEIESVLCNMSTYAPDSEEYTAMTKNLEMLYKAKSCEKDRGIDLNTALLVGGNILIAVLVLTFEKSDSITSKVTSYIFKGRV